MSSTCKSARSTTPVFDRVWARKLIGALLISVGFSGDIASASVSDDESSPPLDTPIEDTIPSLGAEKDAAEVLYNDSMSFKYWYVGAEHGECAVTTLVLRLDDPKPTAGKYQVIARLNLIDGRGWRGLADSESIDLAVTDPTGAPAGMELGQRQILRVRDALLAGEIPRDKAAADEMVHAEFRRPEGFVATALVFAAEGKRRLALLSIDRAIALGSGLSRKEAPAAAGNVVRKPVPFEYYDIRRRFEHMSANESERESPATTSNEALALAPFPPTSPSTPATAQSLKPPSATTPVPTPSVPPRVTAAKSPATVSVPPATAPGATVSTPTSRGATTSIAFATAPQLTSNPADKGARDPKDFPRPERSLRASYNSIWQKSHSQDVATYESAVALEALQAFYMQHLEAGGWELVGKVENEPVPGTGRQLVLNWTNGQRSAAITLVEIKPGSSEIRVSLMTRPTP